MTEHMLRTAELGKRYLRFQVEIATGAGEIAETAELLKAEIDRLSTQELARRANERQQRQHREVLKVIAR